MESTPLLVAARFEYLKHNDDELTFSKGDQFHVIEKVCDRCARGCKTTFGSFVRARSAPRPLAGLWYSGWMTPPSVDLRRETS